MSRMVQEERLAMANIQGEYRREIEQMFQGALEEYAAETYQASAETMDKALVKLTESLGEILDELDRRLAEQEKTRKELVNFASQTQDEIMINRQGLEMLFAALNRMNN